MRREETASTYISVKLMKGDPTFAKNYAASGLRDQLLERGCREESITVYQPELTEYLPGREMPCWRRVLVFFRLLPASWATPVWLVRARGWVED